MKRIRRGLEKYLHRASEGGRPAADRAHHNGWIDILEFAPRGFKLDRPAVAAYPLRLTALAECVASDIEADRS